MKGSLFVITLALGALIVGCAPTASGEGQAVIADSGVTGLEPTPPSGTLELTPVAAPTATVAPAPTATPAPPPSATQLTPTHTPEPSPSPSPTASATPTSAPEVTSPSAPTPAPQSGANQEELVSRGLEVYKEQYCGICHQLAAAETGGKFGPPHDGIGTIAEQRIQDPGYAGQATTAGEYIRESILSPKAYVVPGYEATSHHMPAYAHLEEGDIDALVQMLLHQK